MSRSFSRGTDSGQCCPPHRGPLVAIGCVTGVKSTGFVDNNIIMSEESKISEGKVELTGLLDAVEEVHSRGKTALLLDNAEGTVETFYSYGNGIMVDAKVCSRELACACSTSRSTTRGSG